jgi:hypothetical protein
LDERQNTARGSKALESKGHDLANVIVLPGRGVVILQEDSEFEEPVACSKRCFGKGILIQPDLMISGTKVDLGKEFSANDLIKDIINARYGVAVFHCHLL